MMTEWIKVELEKVCSKVGSNYQPKESSNLPYVGLEHIESEKSMLTNHGFESEIKSSKTMFKKGQILYGKLRPYLDKAVIVPFDGICSTDILVFDSNTESMNEFLIHLIHSQEFIDYAKATTNGVQHPRTSWNSLKQFDFLLPPLPEQRKIAHVLNTVQKAIEQQDKLIRTTTELKKALMQKLFTEGTRGEPQRKTEIRLVPESWEVVNLIDVCEKPQYGFTDSASKEGNAQFLRITDITDYGVKWNEVPFCNCHNYEKYELKNGDIVFARIGATTGKSYLIKNPPKSVYASYLIRVRCKDEILPEFLINYFETEQYWSQINSRKGDNLKGGVNGSILSKLLIAKPSLDEQEKIASIFKVLDEKIDFVLSKKQTLTDLFKTLLYELMTGKRRVHELEFEKEKLLETT